MIHVDPGINGFGSEFNATSTALPPADTKSCKSVVEQGLILNRGLSANEQSIFLQTRYHQRGLSLQVVQEKMSWMSVWNQAKRVTVGQGTFQYDNGSSLWSER